MLRSPSVRWELRRTSAAALFDSPDTHPRDAEDTVAREDVAPALGRRPSDDPSRDPAHEHLPVRGRLGLDDRDPVQPEEGERLRVGGPDGADEASMSRVDADQSTSPSSGSRVQQ